MNALYNYTEFRNLEESNSDTLILPLDMEQSDTDYDLDERWFISKGYCDKPAPWSDSNATCSCTDCRNQSDCLNSLEEPDYVNFQYFWLVSVLIWAIFVTGFLFLIWIRKNRSNNYSKMEKSDSGENSVESSKTLKKKSLFKKMSSEIGAAFEWWALKVSDPIMRRKTTYFTGWQKF